MFKPKTEKIEKIFEFNKKHVSQLEDLLSGNVCMYIDYANVRPWADKLGWNIDLKRLKQFIDSFQNINSAKIYNGTLEGDEKSEAESKELSKLFGEDFKTKPVKIMKHSIDYTSIKSSSTDLLDQFIRRCLLRKYDIETIEYLNRKFYEMNKLGEYYIEDRKCNFDVEISRDMILDFERNNVDTFALWSGDSDFYDPVKQLLKEDKKVILFATARKVARELNELRNEGLIIYDIKKIRNFICYNKQIQEDIKNHLNAKETP